MQRGGETTLCVIGGSVNWIVSVGISVEGYQKTERSKAII